MTLTGEPMCAAGAGISARRGAEECGADPAGAGELLTVTELAVRWRVSKMTIYRLIRSGRAPAVRVGQSYLIPASVASDRAAHSRPQD